jgi:hypothetical protein
MSDKKNLANGDRIILIASSLKKVSRHSCESRNLMQLKGDACLRRHDDFLKWISDNNK